jgi:hypothetical protein
MKPPVEDRALRRAADSIAIAAQCARRLLELRARTGETQ